MITEIVFFDLPKGTTRDKARALYRATAAKWATNPDLIRKYYYFDEQQSLGGGVYIWPNREAAERWHGDDYKTMVEQHYGSSPRIQILDVVISVEPALESFEEV